MDLDLARMYGTPGVKTAAAEQEQALEKQAQAELFAKLAADNGIDLSQLSDEQISGLWSETFGTKLAEGKDWPPPKDEKKDEPKGESKGEKKEESKGEKEEEKKAAAELAAIQDQTQKLAFADQAGRVMAHALVQELNSINELAAKEAAAKEPGKTVTASAAEPASRTLKTKEASAIDQLAVKSALEKAASAGFNTDEATARLNAVFTLGLGASEKVASAPAGDLGAAVEIRSLEFLEAAGYPVEWK